MRIVGRMTCCVGIALLMATAVWGQELVLVENGQSPYRIVVAVDASIQDYHAAEVLQSHIAEMTGVTLKIVGDDNAAVETEIVIGFNRRTNEFKTTCFSKLFNPEEFQIKTIDKRLVIVGGVPRGVLYGVNSFLTEEWGCRWFAPPLRRIPKYEQLKLPQTDRRYQPPFEYRDTWSPSGRDNTWSFHNFQNKDFASLRPEQGGRAGFSHSYMVHTIKRLVQPEKYLKSHPEYFWTGNVDQPRKIPGGRAGDIGLCLSRPVVAKIASETLLRSKREDPEGDLLYSISAGDNNDWCECPLCMAAYGREPRDPHGTQWFNFASRVQWLLRGQPDAPKICMLAYGYTPVPPAKPVRNNNITVMYASLASCQLHAIDNSNCNSAFRERLAGWQKCTDSVYVWLYKVNFNGWGWVHPNLDTLARDLRYLRDKGVRGVFFQESQSGNDGKRFDSDMNELRAYMIARLMWNPDLDWRELRREFCDAYYGPDAAAVMIKYMDNIRAAFVKQDVHATSGLDEAGFKWITPQMFARWHAYMDKAESLATEKEHLRMVRIARLPIMFTEAMLNSNPQQQKVGLQKYFDVARSLGAANLMNEGQAVHTWAQQKGLK